MSGAGPAADESGGVYVATGDGTYNGTTDFGDSVVALRLSAGKIQVQDWYTPQNQEDLKNNDVDLGSGGAVLLPDSHLLLAGGKEGRMYLVDRDHMGKGAHSLHSVQVTHLHDGENYYNIHGTPVLWPRAGEIFVYINGEENPISQYKLVADAAVRRSGLEIRFRHSLQEHQGLSDETELRVVALPEFSERVVRG